MEEGLQQGCQSGCLTGFSLTDLELQLLDIPLDAGIPSEQGIKAAILRCLVLAAREGAPLLLEPIMSLELDIPTENVGKVLGSLRQRRGRIDRLDRRDTGEVVHATVPLAETFGFIAELRGATKGHGNCTMAFLRYEEAPAGIQHRFGLT